MRKYHLELYHIFKPRRLQLCILALLKDFFILKTYDWHIHHRQVLLSGTSLQPGSPLGHPNNAAASEIESITFLSHPHMYDWHGSLVSSQMI